MPNEPETKDVTSKAEIVKRYCVFKISSENYDSHPSVMVSMKKKNNGSEFFWFIPKQDDKETELDNKFSSSCTCEDLKQVGVLHDQYAGMVDAWRVKAKLYHFCQEFSDALMKAYTESVRLYAEKQINVKIPMMLARIKNQQLNDSALVELED